MTTFNSFLKRSWLQDIRFWIILLFLIRLVGITNPPLETGHNWRQSLTNMIARNYHENGLDILHPTIDYGGHRTGIIGAEFPLFNGLIATMADVFGYEHWYGRLINLVVSSIGLYFFFLLIERVYTSKAAFYGTIILGVSIWFAFSRKIMPDTFSISFMLMGLYYGYRFLEQGKNVFLLLFLILSSIGMLCKIPAVYLFALLGIVVLFPSFERSRKVLLSAAAIVSFSIASIWYFYWVPYLVDTYHYQLFFSRGLLEGWAELHQYWGLFFERFYFSALHSFIALIPLAIGLYLLIRKRKKWVLLSLFSLTGIFFLFILKVGDTFPLHNYYIIPFVPVLAFIAGVGLSEIPRSYALPLILLISVEAIANQNHDFFLSDEAHSTLQLSEKAKQHLPNKEAKVVINGGDAPTDMYFLHRRGWSCNNIDLIQPGYLDSLHQIGAKYLVITHPKDSPTFPNYTQLYADEDVIFYDLTKP